MNDAGRGEKKEKRRTVRLSVTDMGAKYQGALEAVLSIPIGAGIGYFCDRKFESEPVGLLVGLALGFGAFVLRIFRMRPPVAPRNDEDHSS
jgi:F0F1-type ATP synthase assembly protein I